MTHGGLGADGRPRHRTEPRRPSTFPPTLTCPAPTLQLLRLLPEGRDIAPRRQGAGVLPLVFRTKVRWGTPEPDLPFNSSKSHCALIFPFIALRLGEAAVNSKKGKISLFYHILNKTKTKEERKTLLQGQALDCRKFSWTETHSAQGNTPELCREATQSGELVLTPCRGSGSQACSHGWNKADPAFWSTQDMLFDFLAAQGGCGVSFSLGLD